MKSGLLLARKKRHLFIYDFANHAHVEGISASETTPSVGKSFNCLEVTIPVVDGAKSGTPKKH